MAVLYLVPTPIGNYDDMTLRGLDVLKKADMIIAESEKEARRLLGHFGMQIEPVLLNEHNEQADALEIVAKIKAGKSAALISDCGTPVFSDPGLLLVQLAIQNKITVVPLPGANSLLPALTASGFPLASFHYCGWLSPKKEIRAVEMRKLRSIKSLLVIMETPYRLERLLTDVLTVFEKNKQAVIAFNISGAGEKFYRGSLEELLNDFKAKPFKGEFILIIDNRAAGDTRHR